MFGIGAEKPSSLSEEKAHDQRDEHLDMMGQGDGPLYPMSRGQQKDLQILAEWRAEQRGEKIPEHKSRWESGKEKLHQVAERAQLRSMDKDEEALLQFKMNLQAMPSDRAVEAIEQQLENLPEDNFKKWEYIQTSLRKIDGIMAERKRIGQASGDLWDRCNSVSALYGDAVFSTVQDELAKRHSPLAESLSREGGAGFGRRVNALGEKAILADLPEFCDRLELQEQQLGQTDAERLEQVQLAEVQKNVGAPVHQFDQAAKEHLASKSNEQLNREEWAIALVERHQEKLTEDIKALWDNVTPGQKDSLMIREVSEYLNKDGRLTGYLAKERRREVENPAARDHLMNDLGHAQALDRRLQDIYLTLVKNVEEREPGMAAQVLLEARAMNEAGNLVVEKGMVHQIDMTQFSGKMFSTEYLPFKDQTDIFIQNTDGEVFRLSSQKDGWALEGQRKGLPIREQVNKADIENFVWQRGVPWELKNESMGQVANIELVFKDSQKAIKKTIVKERLAENDQFVTDLPSRHFVENPKQSWWRRWLPKRQAAPQPSAHPA